MDDLIKKFKFKAAGVVLNAPETIGKELVKQGFKTSVDKKTITTDTLVFVKNLKEFMDFLQKGLKNVKADSVLWFAYPKMSSAIKSDINRDIIRVTGEEFGITTVTAISIDDTWSALRFRPIDKVGK